MQELPVNGRDLVSLAYLIPGAAPARARRNLAPKLTINGSSSLVTNYTVDGYDNTDLFLGGPKVPVAVSATQNLTVMVNFTRPSTDERETASAVTTRSGGQQHSGELFYYASRSQLRLAELLRPEGRQRRGDRRQLPAPVRRRRWRPAQPGTFYFVDAEITRESQDAISPRRSPSASRRHAFTTMP